MPVLICCGLAYCVGLLGLKPEVTRVLQVILGLVGIALFVFCLFGVAIPACFTR